MSVNICKVSETYSFAFMNQPYKETGMSEECLSRRRGDQEDRSNLGLGAG